MYKASQRVFLVLFFIIYVNSCSLGHCSSVFFDSSHLKQFPFCKKTIVWICKNFGCFYIIRDPWGLRYLKPIHLIYGTLNQCSHPLKWRHLVVKLFSNEEKYIINSQNIIVVIIFNYCYMVLWKQIKMLTVKIIKWWKQVQQSFMYLMKNALK